MVEDQQDHLESCFHQLDMFQEDKLQLGVEAEEISHPLVALRIEVIEEDQEVMEVVVVMEMVMVMEVVMVMAMVMVMEVAVVMEMDMAIVVVVVMAMVMEMKMGTETMKVAYPVIEDHLDCKDHKDPWVCKESKEYKDH